MTLGEAVDAARKHLARFHPTDDDDIDGDRDELRISRDAIPPDFAGFLRGKDEAEWAEWLDEMRGGGCEVTFSVVLTRPAGSGAADAIPPS